MPGAIGAAGEGIHRLDKVASAGKSVSIMVASQLNINIRVNQNQHEKITHNARLRGIKPADYVRDLIDKEEKEITLSAYDKYLTWLMRQKKSPKK